MHQQTVEQVMSLLAISAQPAFCIRSNGTLICNPHAKHLAPSCAAALPQWLGQGKVFYDTWDRSAPLQMSVDIYGTAYGMTVQALTDGILFLLTPSSLTTEAENALAVASQVLRQPLSDLNALLYQTHSNDSKERAKLQKQIFRMTRIVSNLSEISRLSADHPRLHITRTNTDAFLTELLQELTPLCESLGRPLRCTHPSTSVSFDADTDLLSRALLNLLSNALKFGAPDSEIILRADTIGTHLVFQVENACTDNSSDLLRAAFSRLSQRDVIPKANWGIGLGLPLANTIARLHGGMVAVETLNGKATVSLSVSLRAREDRALSASVPFDYTGGMRQSLLELSDLLPAEHFE